MRVQKPISTTMAISNKRRFDLLAAAALITGAVWIGFSAPQPETVEAARAEPAEGFRAPDFTLETLAGDKVTLSHLRGQVVLVNLWASWCGPCRAEMPAIQHIYDQYNDQGFTVLAVNITNQDSRAAAQAFVDEFGLSFPVLLDSDGSVSTAYHLRSLPSSYFIDRNGVIQKVVLGGPMAEALVQTQVESLLGLSQ